MPARSPRRWPLALLALPLLGACAMELPDERVIISTRILAIRTAVTGPLLPDPADAETPKAQALPFETVTIEPFLVGPEGRIEPDSVDPLWLACELRPGQGLLACLQDAMPVKLADIPDCEVPSFTDLGGESLPEPPSPCVIARGVGAPEFVVPLSANVLIGGAIELTMIASPPEGTGTDECARELLSGDYELPNDCIFAVQRLSVGPIEQLFVLAEMFGFELEGFPAPDPETIPAADRNPRISEVRVGLVDERGEPIGESTTIERGDVYSVPLGSTLRIDVVSPEEDLQSFPVPVNNGESFEDRDEAYAGDWFRTWGRLLAGTNDDPESYNEWILEQGDQDESETPPDNRAFMYYVVRDGRQGVNWFWFEVEVTEPVEE